MENKNKKKRHDGPIEELVDLVQRPRQQGSSDGAKRKERHGEGEAIKTTNVNKTIPQSKENQPSSSKESRDYTNVVERKMKRNFWVLSVLDVDKTSSEFSCNVDKNQTPFQITRKCNAICVWWVIYVSPSVLLFFF